ncbi:unknown [Prevotella sp. CAG:1124]|nr:unknown [Prevotella sp. CAG:1124]
MSKRPITLYPYNWPTGLPSTVRVTVSTSEPIWNVLSIDALSVSRLITLFLLSEKVKLERHWKPPLSMLTVFNVISTPWLLIEPTLPQGLEAAPCP